MDNVLMNVGAVKSSAPFADMGVGVVIGGAVVSFIVTLVVFVLIVERKTAPRGKFLRWLREFLNFRSILISGLIKFFYLFAAVAVTVAGIIVMCSGRDEMVLPMIGAGFAIIVLGNIVIRLIAEGSMVMIGMWENTSDIRAVLVKDEEAPKEKEPKKDEKVAEEAKKDDVAEEVVASEQVDVVEPMES